MKHTKYTCAVILSLCFISFFSSCEDDNVIPPSFIPQELNDFIYSGSLLTKTEKINDSYELTFETGRIELPADVIEEIVTDTDNWKSTILYKDGTTLTIPTLGTDLANVIKKTTLNPSGYCPLAVEFQLALPVPGRVRVIVEGKNGPQGDIEHLFPLNSANQVIDVLGLYPGYENNVTIILTDQQGKERARTTQKVTTESLDQLYFLTMSVDKSVPEKMAPGLTLVAYLGSSELDTHCPFMVDCDGEVRWILALKTHPQIGNIQTHTGLQRMKNGNFLCADIKTSRIIEMDMLANVKNIWELKPLGYDFHHEVTEMPNGNFLALVSGHNSVRESGEPTISDIIIEVNRESGTIETVWDLKKSLDENRQTTIDKMDWDPQDWAHNNAVVYCPEDDCIIISTRFQGLIKLDRKNNVKWILAPHKGWDNKGLSGKLLDPLDGSGNKITDESVKKGETRHADFDWTWGGHSPVILPDGNIMMFDNGYYRHYKADYVTNFFDPELYSRSVIYKIDENKRTVQEVWQYGEERKRTCWAIAVSSTQYLSQNDHILFCPGIGTIISSTAVGGKVVEVDRATREVVFEANFATPAFLAFHRATRMSLYP